MKYNILIMNKFCIRLPAWWIICHGQQGSVFIGKKSMQHMARVPQDFNKEAHIIHSFIHSSHFYSAPSSPLLLRGAPYYSTDTVSEFHAEAHRQLQVKDLPKVPTWQLERESNPRPSGCKSSTQPSRHHVPQCATTSHVNISYSK